METTHGPQRFVTPEQRPSSPPTTPGTRSRNTSATSNISFHRSKRSYTPPDRDDDDSTTSSSSSSSANANADVDGDAESDDDDPIPEIETKSDVSNRLAPVIQQCDDVSDFEAEEISDDDIAYDDESLHVQPDETEEAESEEDVPELPLEQEDILESLKNLNCGGRQERVKAQEFEEAQRKRYKKKKNRWSIGGTKKRSYTQSIGSKSSDNDDIDPLDDLETGSRRLRRRTYGREDAERPNRSSLLFEKPPAEIEEIGYSETIPEVTIPILEPVILNPDPDPHDGLSSSDDVDVYDSGSDDLNADEDMLVPAWLMEIDSNPPSPSAIVG
ncbi:hypothetical protein E2P81_ATG11566 [Venturia nashicola]|uniref:Uncharacterized protein n=1 Tax=Venturia nashicola TaxID=86259 RepID=A0A4Z1PKR1_9PEZI|nr:hypothetical protein E6O75_ATG11258 [Venturia nashicola]TLD35447.1 hypothetical protein E2P81_ATG11566 [Venturia nashicola]